MKKILVTGAGGFIGSHVAELLVESGYSVKALVRYNSRTSWGWLEDSPHLGDIEVISGDVRDFDSVSKALSECEAVFHLAALIGIPYSYVSPLAYIRTNVEGTYNVLEAAKQLDLEQILITSTSETYGSAQYVPIDEKHPMVGQSPYAATKIAADQLALSYWRSFDLPVKVVRPFNTYGPRQSARAIIPTVITQVLAGEEVHRLGNVRPTRDLTFVKDTALGFLEIFASQSLIGKVTNIGMNEEISILDLVTMIGSLMGKELQIATDDERVRPEASEVERLFCNNACLKKATNWNPQYTLKTGLLETIEWIREHKDHYKHSVYNL